MTILPELKRDVLDSAAAHLPAAVADDGDAVFGALQPAVRSRRRGRRRFLTAGVALTTGAVAALLLLLGPSTSPPAAYALVRHADKSVTVTLHDVATATPRVNAKFARLGIAETVIPITRGCTQPADILLAPPTVGLRQSLTLTAGHKFVLPGWHGVLVAKQVSDGRVGLGLAVVYGRLPSCLGLGYRHVGSGAGRTASAPAPSSPSVRRQARLLAEQSSIALSTTHH